MDADYRLWESKLKCAPAFAVIGARGDLRADPPLRVVAWTNEKPRSADQSLCSQSGVSLGFARLGPTARRADGNKMCS